MFDNQKDKFWRQLIRIDGIYRHGGHPYVRMVIPGWDIGKVIRRNITILPGNIQKLLLAQPDGAQRFYAKANIGCIFDNELIIKDWEEPTVF